MTEVLLARRMPLLIGCIARKDFGSTNIDRSRFIVDRTRYSISGGGRHKELNVDTYLATDAAPSRHRRLKARFSPGYL
jgi:hypothetical protein